MDELIASVARAGSGWSEEHDSWEPKREIDAQLIEAFEGAGGGMHKAPPAEAPTEAQLEARAQARAEAQAQAEASRIKIDSRVMHHKYGKGTIVSANGPWLKLRVATGNEFAVRKNECELITSPSANKDGDNGVEAETQAEEQAEMQVDAPTEAQVEEQAEVAGQLVEHELRQEVVAA